MQLFCHKVNLRRLHLAIYKKGGKTHISGMSIWESILSDTFSEITIFSYVRGIMGNFLKSILPHLITKIKDLNFYFWVKFPYNPFSGTYLFSVPQKKNLKKKKNTYQNLCQVINYTQHTTKGVLTFAKCSWSIFLFSIHFSSLYSVPNLVSPLELSYFQSNFVHLDAKLSKWKRMYFLKRIQLILWSILNGKRMLWYASKIKSKKYAFLYHVLQRYCTITF